MPNGGSPFAWGKCRRCRVVDSTPQHFSHSRLLDEVKGECHACFVLRKGKISESIQTLFGLSAYQVHLKVAECRVLSERMTDFLAGDTRAYNYSARLGTLNQILAHSVLGELFTFQGNRMAGNIDTNNDILDVILKFL